MRAERANGRAGARPGAGVAVTLLLSLASCVGVIGDGDDSPGNGGPSGTGPCSVGCTESGLPIAPGSRFPRMSHAQWEQTVVDLFRLEAPTGLSDSFAPDPLGGMAFDNNQAALEVTPNLWADYQAAAETLASMVVSDPALLAQVAGDPAGGAEAYLESFGARAFRRPLEPVELELLTALFARGAELVPDEDPFVAGVRLTLEAMLQSPPFLYRSELAAATDERGLIALGPWEIASRLSYALWNSMPDDTLFAAAASGALETPQGIAGEADRMVSDPRARPVLRSFFDQLYDADQYLNLTAKSTTAYPDFDPSLGADMRLELGKFADHVVFEEGGGVRELLTSTTTFVSPGLAAIYGVATEALPAADADGFSQVSLDPTERSGLLTRLGFLAWRGKQVEPDSIHRGVFVVRKILCQPLGPPPDAAMGAQLGGEETNRQRIEALTGAGTCGASCHGTFINPAGFALERYGAIGEYRTEAEGQAVDSAATYPFTDGVQSYQDAIQFSALLGDSRQVHACAAAFWVEFLLGRSRAAEDDALVARLVEESLSGGSILRIVESLLASDVTRYRLATKEAE
jgi:hypothetical protein